MSYYREDEIETRSQLPMRDYVERVQNSNAQQGQMPVAHGPYPGSMYAPQFASSDAQQAPQVIHNLDLINKEISELEKTATSLLEELSPVLTPVPPDNPQPGAAPLPTKQQGSIAEAVLLVKYRLESVTIRLRDIRARLEV